MRENPNQPDSFGEDSHFVRVGDGRPARLELRPEKEDNLRRVEPVGLGVVFHCPFERVTHPGTLVFNALIKVW